MKVFLALAFAVFAFGAGYYLGHQQNAEPSGRYFEVQEKFRQLGQIDIEEYLKLKSLEERYKKADEILGKVLLIMLADLGYKLSPEQAEQLKGKPAPAAHSTAEPKPIVAHTPTPSPALPPPAVTPAPSAALAKPRWAQAEARLATLDSRQDIEAFLKEATIPDLTMALRNTAYPSTLEGPVKQVQGHFEGEVTVTGSRPRVFQVVLDADLHQRRNKLSGRAQVELWENGKRFSRSTDRGEPQMFRKFGGDSDALILRASPSDYFQLYYLPSQDVFVGNYYKQSRKDDLRFTPSGTIRLHRH